MPVDRPTFSENWYRVADLRPRLRATVQTFRQHYRGHMWHVVRDQASNQFFRLNDAAFHFVGLLDGKRTIAQCWEICNEALGDRAPTQGEVIQLLGQLYTSNLLHGDMPADAAGMFERYRKRVNREVRSYLMNLLFIRIPIFDPERILDRWLPVFGWIFGPIGLLIWAVVLCAGGYYIIDNIGRLWESANPENLLNADNLMLLYCSFAVIKAIHEFGHGFACKRFGRLNGSGGEVHTIGIMFLVFMPVPYVDASSSWAFRNKWHRAFVGAAGMYVELFVASIAAIVWSHTNEGTVVNTIAYNVMFIASVSTLLFNGNPLLRYDGYYILSDLVEIPNMSQRGKDYFYYLVKKYVYGARNPRNPSHSPGERFWLMVYFVASTIYRVFICAAILLFIADQLFMVGFVLACGAVITWVFVPLGKFVKFLATSPEISRTRGRAMASTGAFVAVLVVALGIIRFPDRDRAEGVVEPTRLLVVHMETSGFIDQSLDSNAVATPDGQPLLIAHNPEIETELYQTLASLKLTDVKLRLARKEDVAQVQILEEQVAALTQKANRLTEQMRKLRLTAPFKGVWVSPEIEKMRGAFVKQGERLGILADTDDLVIRIVANQELGPRIEPEIGTGGAVELRVKGNPDLHFHGVIERVLPAGQDQLPGPQVANHAGGSVAIDMTDQSGTKAAEPFFEVRVKPKDMTDAAARTLLSGQRVVARFEMPSRPLAVQWYRMLRQLLQKRFHI